MNRDELLDLFSDRFTEEQESDIDRVNMLLMIKDTFNISGNAYHEFAKIVKQMPRHYRLKQRVKELNSLWRISPIPDGSGVQQSLEDRLRDRLVHLIKDHDGDLTKVRVKLSGDGTCIGKRLHVINFTHHSGRGQ